MIELEREKILNGFPSIIREKIIDLSKKIDNILETHIYLLIQKIDPKNAEKLLKKRNISFTTMEFPLEQGDTKKIYFIKKNDSIQENQTFNKNSKIAVIDNQNEIKGFDETFSESPNTIVTNIILLLSSDQLYIEISEELSDYEILLSDIKEIMIYDLFSKSNNVRFSLDTRKKITILHGKNGCGKTTVLKIISLIKSGNLNETLDLPFNRIQFLYDKENIIEFDKTHRNDYKFIFKQKNQPDLIWDQNYQSQEEDPHLPLNIRKDKYTSFFHIFYEWRFFDNFNNKYENISEVEEEDDLDELLFFLDGLQTRYKIPFRLVEDNHEFEKILQMIDPFIKKFLVKVPNWLYYFISNNKIHIINSERLLDLPILDLDDLSRRRYHNRRQSKNLKRNIETYSKELLSLKNNYTSEYYQQSQSLNRSFLKRLIEKKIASGIKPKLKSGKFLKEEIQNIEKKQNFFINLGLLEVQKIPDSISIDYLKSIIGHQSKNMNEINDDIYEDREVANVIDLWIKDFKIKVESLEKIAQKITKFKEIINNHLNNKVIKFDSNSEGFYFRTRYSNEKISGTKLSSGEQQIIVLIYQLIFMVDDKSLILIDEPEISLNTSWQEAFIDNLFNVGQEKSLTYIIATHSPQIVNGRTKLTRAIKLMR